MKKIFIVTGNFQVICTAAWYVKRLHQLKVADVRKFMPVGGDNLQAHGVTIFKRFEELNVVGVFEILNTCQKFCVF